MCRYTRTWEGKHAEVRGQQQVFPSTAFHPFSLLKLFIIFICLYMNKCRCTHAIGQSEDNLGGGLFLFFHHVCLGDPAQALRLGDKPLYLIGHFGSTHPSYALRQALSISQELPVLARPATYQDPGSNLSLPLQH